MIRVRVSQGCCWDPVLRGLIPVQLMSEHGAALESLQRKRLFPLGSWAASALSCSGSVSSPCSLAGINWLFPLEAAGLGLITVLLPTVSIRQVWGGGSASQFTASHLEITNDLTLWLNSLSKIDGNAARGVRECCAPHSASGVRHHCQGWFLVECSKS